MTAALVYINGRFLSRPVTGVDRFAREVVVAMDGLLGREPGLAGGRRFVIVKSRSARDEPTLCSIGYDTTGSGGGVGWEQTSLARHVGGALLLNLCNTAPLFKRRQINVVHDAAPAMVPDAYSAAFRRWYALTVPFVGRRSLRTLTVSRFSKGEISKAYRIPADKVVALPLQGVEHIARILADPSVLGRHGLGSRPYVLAVSSRAPHKNFELLVTAMQTIESPGFDLVVAGGTNPRVFAAAGAALPLWVRYVGYVSDGELKALYAGAACFVFPSLYEGYGLPPLEAMACGAPALVARAASMPEVYGDAVDYFDPRDAGALAALLTEVMASPARLDALRERARALVAASTWSDVARAVLNVVAQA